jgi:hypothetical protein
VFQFILQSGTWPKKSVPGDSLNVLDLVFPNFTDLKFHLADSGLVAPDIQGNSE